MRIATLVFAALLAWAGLLGAGPARAVQPGEMLADPVLEARARDISQEIRCLVCRSESIEDSNAELAHDLRVLVRERVTAGDSDQEVKDYLVARYGEYVLLKPVFSAANMVLWLGGPALLLVGGLAAWIWIGRTRPDAAAKAEPLSRAEADRVKRLLEDEA